MRNGRLEAETPQARQALAVEDRPDNEQPEQAVKKTRLTRSLCLLAIVTMGCCSPKGGDYCRRQWLEVEASSHSKGGGGDVAVC